MSNAYFIFDLVRPSWPIICAFVILGLPIIAPYTRRLYLSRRLQKLNVTEIADWIENKKDQKTTSSYVKHEVFGFFNPSGARKERKRKNRKEKQERERQEKEEKEKEKQVQREREERERLEREREEKEKREQQEAERAELEKLERVGRQEKVEKLERAEKLEKREKLEKPEKEIPQSTTNSDKAEEETPDETKIDIETVRGEDSDDSEIVPEEFQQEYLYHIEDKLICPLGIRFSQHMIHPCFYTGYPIESIIPQIVAQPVFYDQTNSDSFDFQLTHPYPSIRVLRGWPSENGDEVQFEDDQDLFTLDNRRLYVLQSAALNYWPLRCGVLVRVMDRLPWGRHKKKFSTTSNGESVSMSASTYGKSDLENDGKWLTWSWFDEVTDRELESFSWTIDLLFIVIKTFTFIISLLDSINWMPWQHPEQRVILFSGILLSFLLDWLRGFSFFEVVEYKILMHHTIDICNRNYLRLPVPETLRPCQGQRDIICITYAQVIYSGVLLSILLLPYLYRFYVESLVSVFVSAYISFFWFVWGAFVVLLIDRTTHSGNVWS